MNREWIDRYNEIISELEALKLRVRNLEKKELPNNVEVVNPVEPKPEGWIE